MGSFWTSVKTAETSLIFLKCRLELELINRCFGHQIHQNMTQEDIEQTRLHGMMTIGRFYVKILSIPESKNIVAQRSLMKKNGCQNARKLRIRWWRRICWDLGPFEGWFSCLVILKMSRTKTELQTNMTR